MLHQVMDPAATNNSTSETLQFLKFNGMNYHVWADNMQIALQAKGFWRVVSEHESCPSKRSAKFPELITMPCLRGDDLMKAMQSKEFLIWEHAQEKYECWLIKDDSAAGLICNAIKYA